MANHKKLSEQEYYSIAKEIFDFFHSVGFTIEQAAAWVATVAEECSFEWWATGDNEKAVGLFQWHPDRLKVIAHGNKQYPGCGVHITKDSKVSTQLEAAWFELRTFEKDALAHIRSAKNAYDAGLAIATYYERCGKSYVKKRGTAAEQWLKYFKKEAEDHKSKLENADELHENSAFKDAKYEANNHTADNWNHNVSNPNFYDVEVSKAPDHTTYYGDFGDKKFKHNEKFEDVYVEHPETVNTATSVVSTKTLKHYANAHISNTVPHNSNRTRGVDDPLKEDFTTDLSNKSEKTKEADAIAVGKSKAEYVGAVESERHVASENLLEDHDSKVKDKNVKTDKNLDKEGEEKKKEDKRVKEELKDEEKHNKEGEHKEVDRLGGQKKEGMHPYEYHQKAEEERDSQNTHASKDHQKDVKDMEKKESTPGSHYKKSNFGKNKHYEEEHKEDLSDFFTDPIKK